eukprot:TRINITY_DN64280_c0_g1_i1.p1 TRINITY_DN64280_c0_g1~~TRINITY_DN64280_c0_g1_i1.p1  ORF type:complete len:801 (-),score=128.95 TRINITY_DN64280_c0_g1_i1:103-2451(-)
MSEGQAADAAPSAPRPKRLVRKESSNAAAPTLQQPPAAASRAAGTCPICFDEIADESLFVLDCGHCFCSECMKGHCTAVAFPVCPDTECDHKLTEEEVGRAAGEERLRAFQEMRFQQALEQLDGRVVCPNPACSNVVLCEVGQRQRVQCHCGWPAFCSMCRQLYHPQKMCSEVGILREQWATWICTGRQQYHGQVQAAEATRKQQRQVQEALQRQHELEADEEYKAENCRCCPQCKRTVQKLEGCDEMKCGENYHGGDKQDGCGARFSWVTAPRYVPRVERRPVPELNLDQLKVEGRDCRHFLVSCDVCGSVNIRGPRFQCIHCPSFNMCAECDLTSCGTHPADHVFKIWFMPEQLYNLDLPKNTRVEFVGLVQNATLNNRAATVLQFTPGRNLYDLKLAEPFEVPLPTEESLGSRLSELIPENVAQRVPYQVRRGVSNLWGSIGSVFGTVVESISEKMGGEASEPSLMPGERIHTLKGVPARFLQLAATSHGEVSRVVEAVETQRSARRRRWTALPEGTKVQVFGEILFQEGDDDKLCVHSQDRATCTRCRLGDVVTAIRGDRMLRGELATVAGPYVVATERFTVKRSASETGCLCEVAAAGVQPLTTKPQELAVLEQFQQAQERARSLRLDLPIGQLVELSGATVSGEAKRGQLATTTALFDSTQRQYTVRPWSPKDRGKHSVRESGRARMAERYGVSDLLAMSLDQMRQLWCEFDLPHRSLTSPDAFVEEAMSFLPEVAPAPLIVSADCLHPIISDAEDVITLEMRHNRAFHRAGYGNL